MQRLASEADAPLPDFLARRLLLDTGGYLERRLSRRFPDEIGDWLAAERARLGEGRLPDPRESKPRRVTRGSTACLRALSPRHRNSRHTTSDHIDRILTHRVWGLLIFALVMVAIFQSVFVWARPLMKAIDSITAAAGGRVGSSWPRAHLRSLLVDGLIGGVGAVLAILAADPHPVLLHGDLGRLRLHGPRGVPHGPRSWSRVGLSGKSFIPMLSSFACAVPGIMAARVIENERDRLTTILVAPLLTCSARLPIYALMIAAFMPDASVSGRAG